MFGILKILQYSNEYWASSFKPFARKGRSIDYAQIAASKASPFLNLGLAYMYPNEEISFKLCWYELNYYKDIIYNFSSATLVFS